MDSRNTYTYAYHLWYTWYNIVLVTIAWFKSRRWYLIRFHSLFEYSDSIYIMKQRTMSPWLASSLVRIAIAAIEILSGINKR